MAAKAEAASNNFFIIELLGGKPRPGSNTTASSYRQLK